MKSAQAAILRSFFLVFDRGDEVVSALRRFAEQNGIRAAAFTALGAFERSQIAWWSWTNKEYERRDVDEQVEVLALTGDVAVEGDETKVHAHVVLGRRDGTAAGGHLMEGIVRPTLELHLVELDAPLRRSRDDVTKLSLLACDDPRWSTLGSSG